jgi:hypothetical protein
MLAVLIGFVLALGPTQPAQAGATASQLSDTPRDSKGHLQPFDCGLTYPKDPGKPRQPHTCDPLSFSQVLKRTKTVAITVHPNLYWDNPLAVRKHVETTVRTWNRFRVVDDPENADLVFEVVLMFSVPVEGSLGNASEDVRRQGVAVNVWPHGAIPQTDNAVWLETYIAKWPEGDAVAGVLRLVLNDIKDCEKP